MCALFRRPGFGAIGDLPWGAHFCLFYEGKQDLLEVLVPYFRAGLEGNEACVWITGGLLGVQDARDALERSAPDLESRISQGRAAILSPDDWYLEDGGFTPVKSRELLVSLLDESLSGGLEGVRFAGDLSWMNEEGWNALVGYERQVNEMAGSLRLLACCCYPLERLSASELLQIAGNHNFSLVESLGRWTRVESAGHGPLDEQIRYGANLLDNVSDAVFSVDMDLKVKSWNSAAEALYGLRAGEVLGRPLSEVLEEDYLSATMADSLPDILDKGYWRGEVVHRRADATVVNMLSSVTLFRNPEGAPVSLIAVNHDITERKTAEREVRRLEHRFRDILDTVRLIAVVLDTVGNITFANDFLLELTGWRREELVGRSWFEVFIPEDERENLMAFFFASISSGEIETMHENDILTRGGERRHIHWSNTILLDVSGGVTGTASIGEDLTERIRAEAALEASNREWANTFDSVADAICLIDPEGVIYKCNRAMSELVGKTSEEVSGSTCWELMHGAKVPVESCAIRTMRETGRRQVETILVGDRWLFITLDPILDEDGILKGAIHTLEDITETKRAEQELEIRARLLDAATDSIFLHDLDGSILYANEAARTVLGYSLDELTGMKITDLISPESAGHYDARIERLLKKGEATFDSVQMTKDGSSVPMEVIAKVIESGGRRVVLSVARDVSERVSHEAELRDFIEIAAHELRHPITVVKGYTITLESYGEQMDEEMRRDVLTSIDQGADRLTRLVNELLDTSRIERQQFLLHEQEASVRALLDRAVEQMRARGFMQPIDLSISDEVGDWLLDPVKFIQVVAILLENALNFSPEGKGVDIEASLRNGSLLVSVADRGPGLPESDRERVFDRLYQVEDVAHHSVPGIGLGLYIARNIVEAHGGRIWWDPHGGGGSVFRFTVPG